MEIIRPIITGSAEVINAALEAISRFDGLANGTRLRPREVRSNTSNSMIDAKFSSPLISAFDGKSRAVRYNGYVAC